MADAVATKFINYPVLAYLENKRVGNYESFSPLVPHYLKPSGKHSFTGSLVVLTNGLTASAAETFVLTLRQLPQVSLVGEPSEGIYSDMFNKELPNGWVVTLSNERYYDSQLNVYEGSGIPPDQYIRNKASDLEGQRDPVLREAIKFIQEKK